MDVEICADGVPDGDGPRVMVERHLGNRSVDLGLGVDVGTVGLRGQRGIRLAFVGSSIVPVTPASGR